MLTIFSYRITEKWLLIAILLLGALLRFWGLGSAEFFHDEGFYAFRSVGYLDYLQNDAQTAPVQWFKDAPSLPWWTGLSFHDAPPLFFLVQNIFFRIFGDSLLIARLPSALAGIASIYLAYLLGKRFFQYYGSPTSISEYVGLLPALLLAVNHIHIWISRSSLLESLQIFLILLNIYYFFVFLENPKKWKMFGITLGLAFLTKYTSFFLAPVYLVYLLIKPISPIGPIRPIGLFKNWRLYAALGLALLLFSPVIIYNFYLYKTVGHFDLQFAYLFHQATPEWRASLGKIQEPFSNLLENLLLMYSIPFLLVTLAGIGYAGYSLIRYLIFRGRSDFHGTYLVFWFLNFLFVTLMFAKVGSAFRFITLYVLPFIFLASFLIYFFSKKISQKVFLSVLGVFLAYELWFVIDGIFLTFPDLGIAKLDSYLEKAIGNERSKILPQAVNPHLDRVIKTFGAKIPPADQSLVIIYDENISLSARIWPLTRRLYYHGIFTLTAGQFKNLLRDQGPGAFKNSRIYFVKATEYTSLNPNFTTQDAAELERFLQSQLNLNPEKVIYGQEDLPMFKIYKFLL